MTCPRCGSENPAGNRFCMKCGADMTATAPTEAGNAAGTVPGYSYTAAADTSGANPPGTQGAYRGTQDAYSGGGYNANTGSSAYGAAPQFAPPPSSYGVNPNMGMIDQGQLVGFGPRFVAYLIDGVLLAIVTGILAAIHLSAIGSLVSIVYFVAFWSTTGQTVGMTPFHIKVAREDGQPLTIGTGILRYVGVIISTIPIFLGLLWVIWDPKKQGWHDKIAHTVVVRAQ